MKMWTYNQLHLKPPADRPPSEPHSIRFWMVEEAVGAGYYITLPGTHHTKAGAERAFPEEGGNFRAVEYQQGRGTNGPERVNDA